MSTEETTAVAGAASESSETRVYEVSYLLVPSLDEAGRSSAVDAIRAHVEGKGGTIINEVYPELIELSYPMDHVAGGKRTHVATAYFGWLFFEAEPAQVPELQQAVAGDPNVVRALTLTTTRTQAETPTHYTFGRFTAGSVEETTEAPVRKEEEEKGEIVEEEVDKAIDELVGEGDDEKATDPASAADTPKEDAPEEEK